MSKPLIVTYRPDTYAASPRTYVVLGAPRGGTSMVAGAIQLLGIPMGSEGEQHEDPDFHDESNIRHMIATVAARNLAHSRWGWKLPNTIYYYRQLAAHLRNPVFIVVYRNPIDIIMSSTSRDGQDLDDSHFNAPVYHYAAMHHLIHDEAAVPTYLMSYEAACSSPEQFVRDLAGVLGTNPPTAMLEACRLFVDPNKGYSEITPTKRSTPTLFSRLLGR